MSWQWVDSQALSLEDLDLVVTAEEAAHRGLHLVQTFDHAVQVLGVVEGVTVNNLDADLLVEPHPLCAAARLDGLGDPTQVRRIVLSSPRAAYVDLSEVQVSAPGSSTTRRRLHQEFGVAPNPPGDVDQCMEPGLKQVELLAVGVDEVVDATVGTSVENVLPPIGTTNASCGRGRTR